jgi:YidC/Oxa1 family membrane protein insertase
MDRNSIIGIIIIAGILIGYTFLTKPNREQIEEQKRIADSLRMVELSNTIASKPNTANYDTLAVKQQSTALKPAVASENLGIYTSHTEGQTKFYTIENNKVKIILTNQGARPFQVELKDYKTFDKKPLILFEGDSSLMGLEFFSDGRTISTNYLYFDTKTNTKDIIVTDTPGSISFKLPVDSLGAFIEYTYTLYPGKYFLDFKVKMAMKSENMPENSKFIKKFSSELSIPYNRTANFEMPMHFYFGPDHFQTLKKIGFKLEELVTLGSSIIRWINAFVVIPIFNWLNNFISNYGIIILLLTIIIKVALLPLTYRSYLSMAKMRVLKPQIDEINAKIPKDKAMERQQATMALYKKVGVNPMGGCLPMILQMPILYAMFRFFPSSIELRQQSFLWAHDLSTYDSILTLPFTIPMYGAHVSLFTILMTVTTILSMKMSGQTPGGDSAMPGMKTMMYIMPVMFMLILNSFSAGLTYYYFLANVITIGQNYLFKFFIDEEDVLKKLNSKKVKAGDSKKSSFQQKLENMAKQRGYKLPK